ncbi:MAG: hypothetical protein LBB13_03710 [Rickettsiales bacterium]|nr:hypothetical protein [Rickettsiales bacterium]
MKIYLGGNSGVGKTSILNEFKMRNPSFSCLSGSQIIMEAYNLHSREEICGIEVESADLEKVYEKYENLVVDGHFRLCDAEKHLMNIFIYVTAEPEKILLRRTLDKGRKRELSLEAIRKEESESVQRARMSGVHPIFVLENNDTLDEAMDNLLRIISCHQKLLSIPPETEHEFIRISNLKIVNDLEIYGAPPVTAKKQITLISIVENPKIQRNVEWNSLSYHGMFFTAVILLLVALRKKSGS